ncbi:MAG: DoxX family membrane protein [Vitreimonas sp.]
MLGLAALVLAVLGIAVGDFALQWQPVPEDLPGRVWLAYIVAHLAAVFGVGVFIPRLRTASLVALSAFYFVWALVLHGPGAAAAPLSIVAGGPPWLGFCEVLSIASGALMLVAAQSENDRFRQWGGLVGRVLFGASLPVFGISHFAYIQFTADMIPAWIPAHVFWAWFTGICHVAAGAAILTGVFARLASLLFAVMVSGFVLLLHVPRVIADPASRFEWTMLAMAFAITAGAWCAADALRRTRD